MLSASRCVDRVVLGLLGGVLVRDSAPSWRNKFASLPLPVRRRRVGGDVLWPAAGQRLFGARRSTDLRSFGLPAAVLCCGWLPLAGEVVGCSVSGLGHHAGDGDQAEEFLSPGFVSVSVRRAPASPRSLGVQFVMELVVDGGLRRLLLESTSGIWAACWWRTWLWVAVGGRCWVWRSLRPRHARSSFYILSIVAGDYRLQPWRCFLPQVLWQAFRWICGVLRFLAAVSLAVFGMYGVRLLRCLYSQLC